MNPLQDRGALRVALEAYQTAWSVEREFVGRFLELLLHPRAFFRDHLPGHITASAWITDESRQQVLLTHHAKLKRWLQPGGHADGEEDVVAVALREASEETGLRSLRVVRPELFDIDIHTIPQRRDFPEHLHYDVRILFEASPEEQLVMTDESIALAWTPLSALVPITGNNLSMLRMAEKARIGEN